MLKKSSILLIVTMLLLMAFAGCMKKPGVVPQPQPPTPVAKTDLILATTTSTGQWFVRCSASCLRAENGL